MRCSCTLATSVLVGAMMVGCREHRRHALADTPPSPIAAPAVPAPTQPVQLAPAPAPPMVPTSVPSTAAPVGGTAASQVAGVWDSVFSGGTGSGGAPVQLTLTQVGSTVTGSYQPMPGGPRAAAGVVNGTLAGPVMTGHWNDSDGYSGPFQLTFSADGRTFTGLWQSNSLHGSWTGTRRL